MRLREISNLIDEVQLSSLDLKEDSLNNGYRLKGLDEFRKIVGRLSQVSAFSSYAERLMETSIFQTALDQYVVDYSEKTIIEHFSSLLKLAARGLSESIANQLVNEKLESISIKLPDAKELKSVISDLTTIEKAISQSVVNIEIDGKVEVNTWEPGSLWIEIYLGSAAATSLVGSIAWAAVVICKKNHEAKIIEEHLRGLKIKNNGLENLLAAQEEAINLQLESEAKALEGEYYRGDNTDPERIQRLQFAIKQFSKLIDRGAEVHPALSAPESVKNLFPSAISPLAIESRIRRIEDSTND